MSQIFNKVEQFVIDSFTKNGDVRGMKHLQRTAYWVQQLRPAVDEALLVAAVGHDLERGFRVNKDSATIKAKGFKSEEHLTYHQEEGARILADYLEQLGTDKEFIERVKMLVSKHEVGGNDDQNLLKDADSISFFENNVEHFLTKQVEANGKDKVKEKFIWMYERISSPEVKKIVYNWYQDAITRLNI